MEEGITTSVKLIVDDNLLVFFKLFCLVIGLDGPSGTAEADAVEVEEEEEEEVVGTYAPLATNASGKSFFSFLNVAPRDLADGTIDHRSKTSRQDTTE